MKGRVIITFDRDEQNERCNYNLKQDGEDILDKKDVISLLQHIISELMAKEY